MTRHPQTSNPLPRVRVIATADREAASREPASREPAPSCTARTPTAPGELASCQSRPAAAG